MIFELMNTCSERHLSVDFGFLGRQEWQKKINVRSRPGRHGHVEQIRLVVVVHGEKTYLRGLARCDRQACSVIRLQHAPASPVLAIHRIHS